MSIENTDQSTVPYSNEVAIPKDLQDSYNAAKSLSLINDLLLNASFNHVEMHKIPVALSFLKALHTQTLDSVLAHKDSDLIDEIKNYKEIVSGNKTSDGKTNSNSAISEKASNSEGKSSSTL